MTSEREFLLNELKEHTIDCDCAKNQHFYDERICRKKAKIFSKLQSLVFLLTIATYVLIVSGMQQSGWLSFIGIVLALSSTMLEIMSYMLRYEDEAMEHWKAAQMYSEIYRKCQFFYSNYANSTLDVWREKLNDISEELSRISSLSPSVSNKSYEEWEKNSANKKYPVHKAIRDLKVNNIQEIIEVIKGALNGYKIEIFLFGSYFSNMYYNDIDIAVILHEDEAKLPLKEKMNAIEAKYSVMGLDLDITIISEKDIIANRCTQFINNICEGECYYKSPEVKKCLEEYSGTLTNYSEMVSYFIEKAEETKKDYRSFVANAFYMYYHALTSILQNQKINWYGERSMIVECEYLANDKEKMKSIGVEKDDFAKIVEHARLFLDEKDVVYVNSGIDEQDLNILYGYYLNDKVIIEKMI